jgi:DNA repair ATPase RecN
MTTTDLKDSLKIINDVLDMIQKDGFDPEEFCSKYKNELEKLFSTFCFKELDQEGTSWKFVGDKIVATVQRNEPLRSDNEILQNVLEQLKILKEDNTKMKEDNTKIKEDIAKLQQRVSDLEQERNYLKCLSIVGSELSNFFVAYAKSISQKRNLEETWTHYFLNLKMENDVLKLEKAGFKYSHLCKFANLISKKNQESHPQYTEEMMNNLLPILLEDGKVSMNLEIKKDRINLSKEELLTVFKIIRVCVEAGGGKENTNISSEIKKILVSKIKDL